MRPEKKKKAKTPEGKEEDVCLRKDFFLSDTLVLIKMLYLKKYFYSENALNKKNRSGLRNEQKRVLSGVV